jgi:hypothetical protein
MEKKRIILGVSEGIIGDSFGGKDFVAVCERRWTRNFSICKERTEVLVDECGLV